jgi:hypothetical protein
VDLRRAISARGIDLVRRDQLPLRFAARPAPRFLGRDPPALGGRLPPLPLGDHAMNLTTNLFVLSPVLATALFALSRPAARASTPFDEASIVLEYNATDEDAEIVVDVDADFGLARFRIVNPLGKEILDLRSRNDGDVGVRKIRLETPEPSLEEVLEGYPEGWYEFSGKTTTGEPLFSLVWLSHALPEAPVITFPLEGATGVPTSGSGAAWTAGPDAAGIFLELESDELGVDVKSNLASGSSSFGFPAGWLAPETEYQLGVAARGANGNLSVVELDFTTGS